MADYHNNSNRNSAAFHSGRVEEEKALWGEFNRHIQEPNRFGGPQKVNHHDFIQWEGGRNPQATPEVNFRLGSLGA